MSFYINRVMTGGTDMVEVWGHSRTDKSSFSPSSSLEQLCCAQWKWQESCLKGPRMSSRRGGHFSGVLFMNGHDVDGPARYLLVFEQEHLVVMGRPCPYLRDELVHV